MVWKIERRTIILYVIWATLIGAFVFSVIRAEWMTAFISAFTFLLTLAPFGIQRRYNIHVPHGFMVFIVLFLYGALFLGEVQDFYERFWWWDVLLHGGSALGIGLIAFVILLMLYQGEKITARPVVISFFAFSFAVAIGALWEIVEFTIDQFLGTNLQKSGLVDTMWDLIVDVAGAAVAAVSGYWYLVRKKTGVLSGFIHETFNKNKARMTKR